ncbi:MAG: lysophospholipid acyltransferase family protein [Actinomycetaceae bacterium]|nr:lysophospholipid acyltransferase family protein [Actinomycetaceae bacterium]
MSKAPKGMYKFVIEACRPLTKILMKPHWKGQENLPTEEPFILIVNHVTEFDPFVIMHFLADEGHAVRALAKESLFRTPLVKHIFTSTKMVPVYRGTNAAGDALKYAKVAIAEGESVAIFPEGTLTRDPDLWPMQFKTGAARLALATGAPVIPLAQWGGHKILHRWRNSLPKFGKRHDTWVVAGKPIDLSDLNQDENDRQAVVEATRRMYQTLTRMVEDIRGEKAPKTPWDPKIEAYAPATDDTSQ